MPARPRCVLLPGFDGSGRLFAPLLAEEPLPFEPRVVPLPADVPRTYDELATWVAARLPADRTFALLAESFSGPLAIRIAARHPGRVTHLVLAATFLRAPLQRWLGPLGRIAHPALFARPPPAAFIRAMLAGWDAEPSLLGAVTDAVRGLPAKVAAARARAALAEDATLAFAGLSVPTLWIHPSADRFLRAGDAEVRALRPETRVVAIAGPHMILQRRPRECLAEIGQFLGAQPRPAS